MVIDASVWVSFFVPTDKFHAQTVAWLEAMLTGGDSLIAPTLLLPEVAGAVARASHSAYLGKETAQQILLWPHLRLVPLDEKLMLLAIELASALHTKGADAIYVATARMEGVPLITWDIEQRTRGGIIVSTRSPGDLL